MLFDKLWSRSHHRSEVPATTTLFKRLRPPRARCMKKGILAIGLSSLIYSSGCPTSIEYYRGVCIILCLFHAHQSIFADFRTTVAYFIKLTGAIYLRMRVWFPIAGMETPGQVHKHLGVLFGLQGEARTTAHHVVHQACVEVHHLVRGFDPDVGVAEDPLRWGEAAAKVVILLVDLMGETALTVVPPTQTQTMLKSDGVSDDYASTEHYEFALSDESF
ncbi:uncharacterized protein EV420DRAFT_1579269 [Desarmillaria tabescens]|uniref:Uncharacterized protein n=1 Tax=Armillaria tabescens TaxID=1929756 RepID=A0AA39JG64_ARMTA|nr:uncharacterized protein EV420DRAFT_1579269 [Desarmillaria tabescens]KAK0442043.1 hypothetical protein EV420DRAFT_1579269 [Desarmillaria tabescens]